MKTLIMLLILTSAPLLAYDKVHIKGDSSSNVLHGNAKTDDLIEGFDGADILKSYGQINFLFGGKGSDTYYHEPMTETYDTIKESDYYELNTLICKFPSAEKAKCERFNFDNDLFLSCSFIDREGFEEQSTVTIKNYRKKNPEGYYHSYSYQKWYISCGGVIEKGRD